MEYINDNDWTTVRGQLLIGLNSNVCGLCSAHHLLEEAHHYVGVDEGCVVPDEGLGDVGHDAGVVPGETFSAVHLHEEASPGPLGGVTFWNQQVPEGKETWRQHIDVLQPKRIDRDSLSHEFTSRHWRERRLQQVTRLGG